PHPRMAWGGAPGSAIGARRFRLCKAAQTHQAARIGPAAPGAGVLAPGDDARTPGKPRAASHAEVHAFALLT
ncbi:MAG: hypothetical protein JJU36_15710, partial [Phycisphaeraceae bacterium]|nr:hypothetical protein [Phycisphaeraceae bacterium]